MRRVSVVASVAVAACGQLVGVTGEHAEPVDGGGGGGGAIPPAAGDAGVDASDASTPACDRDASFGTAQPFAELTLAKADHVWLAPDELSGWFSTAIGLVGADDLFSGARPSTTSEFTTSKSGLSTTDHDEDRPSLSADGKVLVYASVDAVGSRIMVAMRADPNIDFTSAAAVDLKGGVASDTDPWLARDGTLYFTSDRDGKNHIYSAAPVSPGQWAMPTRVPGLDGDDDENAILTDDQLVIFFGRTPSGQTDADVYMAVRQSRFDGFAAPQPILTLAKAGQEEYPTWTTADGCTLYVSHDPGIFVAKRGP